MFQKQRKNRLVHEPYLVEWLGVTYPPGTWRTNVYLGDKLLAEGLTAVTPRELSLLSKFAANVDAICLLPFETHLVEAMVRHEPGVLEDLYKYRELLPYTRGYEQAATKTIRLKLVTPLELGWMEGFYQRHGVEVIHYSPPWILEYLHTYPRREWRGKLSALTH